MDEGEEEEGGSFLFLLLIFNFLAQKIGKLLYLVHGAVRSPETVSLSFPFTRKPGPTIGKKGEILFFSTLPKRENIIATSSPGQSTQLATRGLRDTRPSEIFEIPSPPLPSVPVCCSVSLSVTAKAFCRSALLPRTPSMTPSGMTSTENSCRDT